MAKVIITKTNNLVTVQTPTRFVNYETGVLQASVGGSQGTITLTDTDTSKRVLNDFDITQLFDSSGSVFGATSSAAVTALNAVVNVSPDTLIKSTDDITALDGVTPSDFASKPGHGVFVGSTDGSLTTTDKFVLGTDRITLTDDLFFTSGGALKTNGGGDITLAPGSNLNLNPVGNISFHDGEYSFPTTDGTDGQVLQTDGAGNLSFAAAGGSDTNLGNTNLTADDNRTYDQDGNDLVFDPNGGEFQINDSTGPPSLAELSVAQGVTNIRGNSVNINGITYPSADGTNGQVITTDGSGNLSFQTAAGGGAASLNYLSLKMGSDVLQGGASQQDFTSATAVKTKFNTADDSEGTGLTSDTTNNRITVSSDGLYRLTANLSFYSTGARTTPTTFFKINGTTNLIGESYGYIRASNGQNENSNNVTRVVRLSANDYIEVWHFDASTLATAIYATQALFEVESVGGIAGADGADGAQGPSGTSYDVVTLTGSTTLSSSHTTKYLVCNSASAMNLTVPASASYDTYAEFVIEQRGAGQVTVVADTGVTIHSTETLQSGAQYAVMGLKRTATNTYVLTGERQAS